MNKKAVIRSCNDCKYVERGLAFRRLPFAPYCCRELKELPYTIVKSPAGVRIAEYTGEIPTWCPLEDDE